MRRSVSVYQTVTKANSFAAEISWLDLRGSGLSALERLCLEEALLRHDVQQRSWAIVGTHEPTEHRFLKVEPMPYINSASEPNSSCIIVMGLGGKADQLLDVDLVKKDGVMTIKRFSGGGTVVLDHNSLWTTFIGRKQHFPEIDVSPRPIMSWSAEKVFGPTFLRLQQQLNGVDNDSDFSRPSQQSTLVVDSKSCGTDNSGSVIQVQRHATQNTFDDDASSLPAFALRENDYVLGERKMGGNAQAIAKDGWLHHTSFLWDYDDENMEYLTLPSKRPEYRGDRTHSDFLVKLNSHFRDQLSTRDFFTSMKESCAEEYNVETVTPREAMALVNDQLGSLQQWFDGKCRTKVVDL